MNLNLILLLIKENNWINKEIDDESSIKICVRKRPLNNKGI